MLKREEYRFTVRRPYPPLYLSLFDAGHCNEDNFKGLYNEKFSLSHLAAVGEGDIYYSGAELDESARLGYEAMESPVGLHKVQKELVKRERELIRAARGEDLTMFGKTYERYVPALLVGWSPEDLVVERLYGLLNGLLPQDEADELVSALNIPLKSNYYKQEEYDLVSTVDIVKHVKKYEWINSRYGNYHPYTTREAEKKRAKINKRKFLKDWENEKKAARKSVSWAKKLLRQEKHIVDVMQFLIYYRTQRTDILNRAIYLFIPALRKIAADKNFSYEQALHCTIDELLSGAPAIGIVKERIKGFSMIMEDKVIKFVSGEEGRKIQDYFALDVSSIKEIAGKAACRGKVKGKAYVVHDLKDLKNVREGGVLITSMTTPNMIGR